MLIMELDTNRIISLSTADAMSVELLKVSPCSFALKAGYFNDAFFQSSDTKWKRLQI